MDKKLVIRLSIEEHRRIKVLAANLGITMKALVLTSSLKRIKDLEDEANKVKK